MVSLRAAALVRDGVSYNDLPPSQVVKAHLPEGSSFPFRLRLALTLDSKHSSPERLAPKKHHKSHETVAAQHSPPSAASNHLVQPARCDSYRVVVAIMSAGHFFVLHWTRALGDLKAATRRKAKSPENLRLPGIDSDRQAYLGSSILPSSGRCTGS